MKKETERQRKYLASEGLRETKVSLLYLMHDVHYHVSGNDGMRLKGRLDAAALLVSPHRTEGFL